MFDPRTKLLTTLDDNNVAKLVQDFEVDCQSHDTNLGGIWSNLDEVVGGSSLCTAKSVANCRGYHI